jgi:long-chain acyl-CoA synthetase
VIVLETGKNIYPEEIEWELAASPYIEEVLVKGGHRQGLEVICAYVYPKWDAINGKASPHEAKHLIWEEIKRTSRNLASYKRIKSEHDVFIMGQPFAKTSKLDIKRYLYQGELQPVED